MTEEIRVTPRDAVKAGLCLAGARQWAELHGLDFAEFMRVGTRLSVLRGVKCPLAGRACDQAEKRVKESVNGQQ